ncbi:MAG: alpha/beta hydrolase [Paenisporosarcina sp.]
MKTGMLCIHGFTGGPYEVRPFVEFIESKTDWVVKTPTLPGHGPTLSLKNLKAENWMMEAEQALRLLQKEVDRVVIVGFSMGGLIALYLSLRYKIDQIVLLSAAAKYISGGQLLNDVKEIMADAIQGKISTNTFYHLYEYKLTHTPFKATIEFLRIVKMVEPYYASITTPVCIVQGKKDGIVPFGTAEYLYDQLGSSEKLLVISEGGKHHICYSNDCDDWFNEVLVFLQQKEKTNYYDCSKKIASDSKSCYSV